MENAKKKENEKQILRMEAYCLSLHYTNVGEIYKLLKTTIVRRLIKCIINKSIEFECRLENDKKIYTMEEKFLNNLDQYINYIKSNYTISHYELVKIIEYTLDNKYNKILFSETDYYDNYDYYIGEYSKMFLFNFLKNIKFYHHNYYYINLVYQFVKTKSINNDIKTIEQYFVPIINNRKDNLLKCFKSCNNIKKDHYDHYAFQLDWLFSDYFDKH